MLQQVPLPYLGGGSETYLGQRGGYGRGHKDTTLDKTTREAHRTSYVDSKITRSREHPLTSALAGTTGYIALNTNVKYLPIVLIHKVICVSLRAAALVKGCTRNNWPYYIFQKVC